MSGDAILIAGGGIGGLALAIALQKGGREVRVFEKIPELKEVGAAIVLWPNATGVLRDLGVLPSLLDRSDVVTDCEIRTSDGRHVKRWKVPRLETPAVFVSRADLQSVLAATLPLGLVRLGNKARRFEETVDGVMLHLESGGAERGRVLVGADGLHSVLRSQLIGPTDPVYQGYTTWRAIVKGAPEILKPGFKMEWWGRGTRFGIGANGRGWMNWYLSANRPSPEASPVGKARLLEWVTGWKGPAEEIIASTPEDVILKADIWARPPSKVWGHGHVTLLGDAAHPTSPNLGQGAGMAIEDAACLAACLNGRRDPIDSLRRYEILRRRRTGTTTKRSGLIGRMGQWSHPALVAARTAFLRAFPSSLWERQLRSLYSYHAAKT